MNTSRIHSSLEVKTTCFAVCDVFVDDHEESPLHTNSQPKLAVVLSWSNAWKFLTVLIRDPTSPAAVTNKVVVMIRLVAEYPRPLTAIFLLILNLHPDMGILSGRVGSGRVGSPCPTVTIS